MKYYLVCDGGGTKTDFLLFDRQGKVYACDSQIGTNVNFIGKDAALNAVMSGIENCASRADVQLNKIERIILFIPGFKPCLAALRKQLGRDDILLYGDMKNAYYGALASPYGIVVLSGTGSFAMGRDKNGNEAICGGWGPLFGDGGSGYHIGVLCLARVAWLYDNRITSTLLEKLCLEAMNITSAEELRTAAYRPGFTRKDVAGLSKIVGEAARRNDPYALEILKDAVKALMGDVKTLSNRLSVDGLPVALTGGVAKMGAVFEDLFKTELTSCFPQCYYQPAKYDPLVGAALCLLYEHEGCNIEDDQIAFNLMKYKE
jgi:N-acetylglucosamine kinase-like BadF-type ATPase